MSRKIKSGPAAFKLAAAFIVSVVIQSILMSAILIYGGVLKQSRENAYQIFSEKVNSRADTLESEMKNVWTNFEHYTNQISQYFTEQNMTNEGMKKTTDEMLEDMAPIVMNAMYYTKTTGAFLILEEGTETDASHPALYFRNVNPNLNDDVNSNIYLLAGPWGVTEKMQIVTDANWNFRLKLDESNRGFYEKPFHSIRLADDHMLLGYWSPPFHVTPKGEEVITYSVPLTDANGNGIGVFGVEISVEYLYKFLPISDLKANNSYGYLIGIRNGGPDGGDAMVTHGALQKSILDSAASLKVELKDESKQIYSIEGGKSKKELYACINAMGMYYNNTPFAGEEWYLVGLIDEPSLLEYPDRIKTILISSFFISLIVGTFVSIIISRWFTKYSRLIELSEVPVGVFEMSVRSNKVHMTNQVPRLLGMTRKQEHQFCKDREGFRGFLETFCKNTTDEADVYQAGGAGEQRWIRITMKSKDETTTGIVEDVTEDIRQKKDLKKERDYDGLTGVLNRRAFKQISAKWNECLKPGMSLCIIMFDLNELKEVNDLLGHNQGDEYICYAAKAISEAFLNCQIFRIGGDEFTAVTSCTDEEELMRYGRNLTKKMDEYRDRKQLKVGIAWGYAYYNAELDTSFEQVLSRADMNMYEHKRKMKTVIY